MPDCLQVAQLLLDRGSPINAIRYQNHHDSYEHFKYFGLGTPLYEAAQCGNFGMAELLLKNGADPLLKATGDRLPIEVAESKGHTALVDLLKSYSASPSVEVDLEHKPTE